jgi:hypothetical protein
LLLPHETATHLQKRCRQTTALTKLLYSLLLSTTHRNTSQSHMFWRRTHMCITELVFS